MRKVIIISLLIVFVLSGYFIWQSGSGQNENNKISGKYRILDFERPKEEPSISGIVKTIIGNEIAVLKIERAAKFKEENDKNKDIEKSEDDEKEESAKEQRPASGFGRGMGMGGKLNAGIADDEKLAMLKSLSTGEEKITIPVGIKMLKSEDGEMVEATLDDIAKDQMLIIWTDKTITDKNIANFVIIK